MHTRATEFSEIARDRYDFDPPIKEFSAGTETAADAADAVGCAVGQIASSIVVETDRGLALIVTSGANRVDMDRAADVLGVEAVSMADPDEIHETVGWSIGGVPPFCHETDLPVVIDETLFDYDKIWAAAGTPQAVFELTPATLESLSGGTRASIAQR
ncbi:MAG: YbaK/EbsC family protein [Halobacteriales archaeon]|nr:YbaK/EbsC family protein [Halobacteriales archaeon]